MQQIHWNGMDGHRPQIKVPEILDFKTVSYTNKQYSVVFAWRVGKAVYCCARAVQ